MYTNLPVPMPPGKERKTMFGAYAAFVNSLAFCCVDMSVLLVPAGHLSAPVVVSMTLGGVLHVHAVAAATERALPPPGEPLPYPRNAFEVGAQAALTLTSAWQTLGLHSRSRLTPMCTAIAPTVSLQGQPKCFSQARRMSHPRAMPRNTPGAGVLRMAEGLHNRTPTLDRAPPAAGFWQ